MRRMPCDQPFGIVRAIEVGQAGTGLYTGYLGVIQ